MTAFLRVIFILSLANKSPILLSCPTQQAHHRIQGFKSLAGPHKVPRII